MSKQEEPSNSKAHTDDIQTNIPKSGEDSHDYKAEYYALMEFYDNVFFQMQLTFRNIKAMGLERFKAMQQQQSMA